MPKPKQTESQIENLRDLVISARDQFGPDVRIMPVSFRKGAMRTAFADVPVKVRIQWHNSETGECRDEPTDGWEPIIGLLMDF